MPLPSCEGSRSWLRNPRAPTTSKRPPSSPKGDPDSPSGSPVFSLLLAERADEAFLGDIGYQYAVLEEAAGREPEAIRGGR